MRIDIGTQGQVIGTKKVNANGHVAGLKSHAGQELLLVATSTEPKVRYSLADRAVQARQALRSGFEQARGLGSNLGSRFSMPRLDAKQVVVLGNQAAAKVKDGTARIGKKAQNLSSRLPLAPVRRRSSN